MYEPNRERRDCEAIAPDATFAPSRETTLPAPTDPYLLERYLSLQGGEPGTGNDSIEGGFNLYYLREKFTGRYAESWIERMVESYLENNDLFEQKFRACGRFDCTADELREVATLVKELQGLVPIELEYYYETKSGDFKVGIGINGPNRYNCDSTSTYYGAESRNHYPPYLPPKNQCDLVELQNENYGQFYRSIAINPEIEVIDNTQQLSVDQRYQLAILYLEAFGPGWSYHSVEQHDHLARPIRIGVHRTTGEVVAACLADSDETTVEFTEWVAKKGVQGAAVMVGAVLIDACMHQFPDKTLYGEFRTTSPAAKQGLRMGFALPHRVEGVKTDNLIKANVKVEGELTDFVPLVYSYNFDPALLDELS